MAVRAGGLRLVSSPAEKDKAKARVARLFDTDPELGFLVSTAHRTLAGHKVKVWVYVPDEGTEESNGK